MSSTEKEGLAFDAAGRTWSILSGQLEAFIQAWETRDAAPAISEFITASDSPVVRRMTLIELIKVDLEYRWTRQSEPRPLEEYFALFPELAGAPPADLIYEEFHIRRQAGENVSQESCLRRFPNQAHELERLFGVQQADVSTALIRGRVADVAADLQPGERVDDFDLLTHLGKGAFASVFLARQNSMQRLVALKISADRGNEPQTLAQLDHDHIVRVYDQRLLPERGFRLLYMQYIPGGTLHAVVESVRGTPEAERTGQLLFTTIDRELDNRGETRPEHSSLRGRLAHGPWPEVVCRIGARLARALDYAHRQGVLHRDLKPANVLLAADGSPKLADFNISFSSKIEGATPAAYFGGSLAYMSPEQLEACNPAHDREPDSLDGRSDLYSLGVLLWELLTGARPFVDERVNAAWSETLGEMASRRRAGIDRQNLAQLSRRWPAGLEAVLARCLEPEPANRFTTGAELARQLELCLQPKTQRLLAPQFGDWRRLARRFPATAILLATLVPNMLAAVFNYHYNRVEIVEHLKDAKDVFWRTQMIINSIAFPIGLATAVGISWPVARNLRGNRSRPARDAGDVGRLRRQCLRFGHYAAGISLTLWLLAAPAYPIALSAGVAVVPMSVYVHFVASLAICGLIAAAYPFFIVSCLAACSFYPVLVPLAPMTEEDANSLTRLGRAAWFYLFFAASVPMIAVAVLTLIGSEARFALGTLAAGGVGGFVAAFVMFRTLQADLAALLPLCAPTSDASSLSADTFGSFTN